MTLIKFLRRIRTAVDGDTHGRNAKGLHWIKGAMSGVVSANLTTALRKVSLRHNSSPKITRLLILAIKCVMVSNTGMLTAPGEKFLNFIEEE